MDYFNLSGQTAVVTGAAAGIGTAIARRLAGAGAQLVIADINHEAAAEVARSIPEKGGRAFSTVLDITDPESVRKAVSEVLTRTARIDIWVNNAGIAGKAAPIWDQSDDDWHRVIQVNLTGAFYCCRAVIPHMRERKYGRIVNIASIAGKEGNPNMVAYSASKAGVIALTKSLAKEVALDGICVNSIAPAVVGRTSWTN